MPYSVTLLNYQKSPGWYVFSEYLSIDIIQGHLIKPSIKYPMFYVHTSLLFIQL